MKKAFFIPILLILIVIVLLLSYSRWNSTNKKGITVEATGMIEAVEVDLSPKIPEKIEWLCCKEGDTVKKGTILIRMDNREITARVDEIKAGLRGAEAGYNASLANHENAGTRIERANAEIKAAGFEVERATAVFEDAQVNFNRISELYKQGFASKKDMDTVKAEYNATDALLKSSLAKKHSIEADLSSAKSNLKASDAQVTYARVNIKEAEARLRLAQIQLRDTEVSSPLDGVIVYKYFEEGEITTPGRPVYTIYNMKDIWARVDIEETDIGKIRPGGNALITAGSSSDRANSFNGSVTEISREAEFATQRDVTRGRQDIKTFKVKVAIKDNNGILKPGMTVKVLFK